MAEEVWRVILQEEYVGGAAPSAGGTPSVSEPSERKAVFQDLGRFIAPLAGIGGAFAFVITMIQRSKIFSTFMDNLLMIISTVVDILFIPLIPLIAPVLQWALKLFPLAKEASESIKEFLKDPWKGIEKLFSGIGGLYEKIGKIFDDKGGIFSQIMGIFGGIMRGIGQELSEHGKKIWDILTDKGLSFWEKIKAIGEEVWIMIGDIWKNVVVPAAKELWELLKKWWIEDIFPIVKDIWEKVWNFIRERALEVWDKIANWFMSNIIIPLMEQWNYLVKDYLPALWQWLVREVAQLFSSLLTGPLAPITYGLIEVVQGIRGQRERPQYNPPSWSGININVNVSGSGSSYLQGREIGSGVADELSNLQMRYSGVS